MSVPSVALEAWWSEAAKVASLVSLLERETLFTTATLRLSTRLRYSRSIGSQNSLRSPARWIRRERRSRGWCSVNRKAGTRWCESVKVVRVDAYFTSFVLIRDSHFPLVHRLNRPASRRFVWRQNWWTRSRKTSPPLKMLRFSHLPNPAQGVPVE